jgi:hypothetical protein
VEDVTGRRSDRDARGTNDLSILNVRFSRAVRWGIREEQSRSAFRGEVFYGGCWGRNSDAGLEGQPLQHRTPDFRAWRVLSIRPRKHPLLLPNIPLTHPPRHPSCPLHPVVMRTPFLLLRPSTRAIRWCALANVEPLGHLSIPPS